MTKVTKIDWTIKTGEQWWSGTDTQIKIEIYRDNDLMKRLNLLYSGELRRVPGTIDSVAWLED